MKLKNITDSVRALRDNGKFIEVEPGEIIEVERPVFNDQVFEVIDAKKSKEKKTLNLIKNEKLNKENKTNGTS